MDFKLFISIYLYRLTFYSCSLIIQNLYVFETYYLNFRLIFSLILAAPVIYSVLRFKLDKLVVTNKTFYLQQGVINIERITLPLNKIQSMVVQQGLLGRILNYGDIVYQSASKTGTSVYKFVVNPHELTNILNEYQ